jgi:hypothetical protein
MYSDDHVRLMHRAHAGSNAVLLHKEAAGALQSACVTLSLQQSSALGACVAYTHVTSPHRMVRSAETRLLARSKRFTSTFVRNRIGAHDVPNRCVEWNVFVVVHRFTLLADIVSGIL